eukprot:GEZU01003688.1.p1 GENE.GEZU01003688.1~~GEZU01003688.1.p1  ORF type:complete len:316 (+),score=59.54 GEZU01003688.1:55-948(+)
MLANSTITRQMKNFVRKGLPSAATTANTTYKIVSMIHPKFAEQSLIQPFSALTVSMRGFHSSNHLCAVATPFESSGPSQIFAEATEPIDLTGAKQKKPKKEKLPSATASIKGMPASPFKLNQICKFIRGMSAREAMTQLQFMEKRLAGPVRTCVQSAIFNAENHKGLNADRLLVREAYATKGQFLRRIKYHSKGRFGIMHHPRSHLTIVLEEVPYSENEKRLGKAGWTNKTWEAWELLKAQPREAQLAAARARQQRKSKPTTAEGVPQPQTTKPRIPNVASLRVPGMGVPGECFFSG